ncbi:CD82 molecule S homeolog [Xenopus laevis]|uniref:Tetraspanin n=1 Tax=Xenopus laevis TaxID=8355 RepID=Q6GNW4_XENLA|nr:CD82 molecule S homeolog [Xenopus laevis]AAH73387.1 MGC80828 protein [Xenopus laevis]
MATSGCMKVTKYFLFLFNLLFFILGAVILGFGIWILVDKTSFISVLQTSSWYLRTGSYILIAVGGCTMVMGFLGCLGAVNEIRCLLGLYFTFLLIILIAQVAAGILIYLQRDTLKTEMSSIIHDLIVTYDYEDGKNTSCETTWDYIQRSLQCCGWTSYQNWTENALIKNSTNEYPCSCMTNQTSSNGFCEYKGSLESAVYKAGCMQGVESWLQDNLGIILGVCVGVAVIELLGLILSMCLCRNIQSEDYTKVPKY